MNIGAKLIWPALAAFLAAGAAQAQSWDAVGDFSYTQNPNGTWQYGYGVTGTSFTPFSQHLYSPANPSLQGWVGEHPANIVYITTGSTYVEPNRVLIQSNTLLMHPGAYGGQDSIVQWTAPTTASYKISANFVVLDSYNYYGDRVSISTGGTNLFSETLLGGGAQGYVPGTNVSYGNTVSLKAGQTVSFGEALNKNYGYNTVGLKATITQVSRVPEVSSNGSLAALLVVFALGAIVFERSRCA